MIVINKVILMGRLTKDPETKYSMNGSNTAVCKTTVVVDRRFQRQGEERQADFIPVVAFGKTAEFIQKYFNKGSKIAIVGAIQTRTWDDADGKKHYATEVIAEEVHFADSKKSGAGNNQGDAFEPQTNDGFYSIDDDSETLPF